MKNNQTIKLRLEKIKKIEDAQKALSELADIQYEIGTSACEERKALQTEVNNLRKVLIGNGDPENSLLTRVTNVELFMENMRGDTSLIKDDVKEIKDTLLGKLVDGKKIQGFVDRLEDVEKVTSALNKITWIVVGAIIVEVALKVIGLL